MRPSPGFRGPSTNTSRMAMIVAEAGQLALAVVEAFELDSTSRAIMRPDEMLLDRHARARRLHHFIYQVDSWQTALESSVTEHFELWEFMGVDLREAQPIRIYPRYVPCAVSLLAAHLELFRGAVGTFVHVAANGGYRSPAHRLTDHASVHCWGSA